VNHHPTGKALFADSHGRLWLTSREIDQDGTVAYTLLRVSTELVDAFHHKYEAIAAAEEVPL
jgi:hypothetical protein